MAPDFKDCHKASAPVSHFFHAGAENSRKKRVTGGKRPRVLSGKVGAAG